jgi:hypothetical protein
MLLTPEILTLDILNILLFPFATIAFYYSLKIVLYFDGAATTPLQYRLEKQSYLVATIINFIFFIKIVLFIFFIFTLDKIASLLPGAMCGAGVVNATGYGTPLLMLKILNLYIFGYWIVLNKEDMKSPKRKYLRLKFALFCLAYILLVIEMVSQMLMFASIDTKSVVDCCGAIFSKNSQTYMATFLSMPHSLLVALFYGLYLLLGVFYLLKNRYFYGVFNILFMVLSLITLIAFFGTYIYELPTHHCPFCLLQSDYHYIGYILYSLLFLGTFFGFIPGVIAFERKEENNYFRLSLFFNTLYVVIVSYYPLVYYYKNGVWL